MTEAATLVGLCKNPSYFNPVRNPERSRERRNVVLQQMVKEGYLSEADYKKYSAQPMELKFHTADHKEGMAVYLREFLRRYMTAKKPERALYPSWNMVKYYVMIQLIGNQILCTVGATKTRSVTVMRIISIPMV